jgi:hypothetical protein
MPTLRFPNSQSDLDRLVFQLRLIAKVFPSTQTSFGLDAMRDVLAGEYQISSSGASGSLAVTKSTRTDRSRDPLYNQVKSMSELYRMFGWIRSIPSSRLEFRMTNLGLQLALDAPDFGKPFENALVRESILRVVFPNATTVNIGVTNHRPFAWMIQLANKAEGMISRDELIYGVLAVTDDLEPKLLDKVAKKLIELRSTNKSGQEAAQVAKSNQVQINTLQNYTRIPIGVLSSPILGIAKKISVKIPGQPKKQSFFQLTEFGRGLALNLESRNDIRAHDLVNLSTNDRCILADFSYFDLLRSAGIDLSMIKEEMDRLEPAAAGIIQTLGFHPDRESLFNPELQESDEILELAAKR